MTYYHKFFIVYDCISVLDLLDDMYTWNKHKMVLDTLTDS